MALPASITPCSRVTGWSSTRFDATVPGDDVRDIDWNVTARTGEPHIKSYIEERELTVMLAVDVSRSGEFGTRNRFKRELAVELAAVMAFAATTNNDTVGIASVYGQGGVAGAATEGQETRAANAARPDGFSAYVGIGTDLKLALDTINLVTKRRGIVFLVSDFLAEPDSYRHTLVVTNRRHDVVAFDLKDPLEQEVAEHWAWSLYGGRRKRKSSLGRYRR